MPQRNPNHILLNSCYRPETTSCHLSGASRLYHQADALNAAPTILQSTIPGATGPGRTIPTGRPKLVTTVAWRSEPGWNCTVPCNGMAYLVGDSPLSCRHRGCCHQNHSHHQASTRLPIMVPMTAGHSSIHCRPPTISRLTSYTYLRKMGVSAQFPMHNQQHPLDANRILSEQTIPGQIMSVGPETTCPSQKEAFALSDSKDLWLPGGKFLGSETCRIRQDDTQIRWQADMRSRRW